MTESAYEPAEGDPTKLLPTADILTRNAGVGQQAANLAHGLHNACAAEGKDPDVGAVAATAQLTMVCCFTDLLQMLARIEAKLDDVTGK